MVFEAAAIQFPLGHPGIATILTGVRSAAEWADNKHMFRYPIRTELWQEFKAEGLLAAKAPVPD